MPRTPVIAIVEDDEGMREALGDLLDACGVPFQAFAGAREFLAAYEPEAFACLITDLRMPGMDGLALLRRLTALGSTIPIIIVTSSTDRHCQIAALDAGAYAYLVKPINNDVLIGHLRSAAGELFQSSNFNPSGRVTKPKV